MARRNIYNMATSIGNRGSLLDSVYGSRYNIKDSHTGVSGVELQPEPLPEDQHFKYYPPSEVYPLQQIIAKGNEWCYDVWVTLGETEGTGMNWGDFQTSGMCNDEGIHPGKKDHRYDWGYDNF